MAEAFRFRHVPQAVADAAGLAMADPRMAALMALLDDRDRQLEDHLSRLTPTAVWYWQDKAALLDPNAYEFVLGANLSHTVPAGKRWYLVNAWYIAASGGGISQFHRPIHVDRAHLLSPGSTVSTPNKADAHMYLCKPELVVAGDSRYQVDPQGLYFKRLERLATEVAQHQIGAVETGNATVTVAFPTDFTDAMALHTSSHDVAWLILLNSAGTGGPNTLNEISDSSPIRFAEPTLAPFKRTTFPSIMVRGASLPEGRATLTYAKLPADW